MLETVRELLRDTLQLGSRADSLEADSPLLGEVPELDSMAVVTLLTLFEEEFDISIRDDEVSADTFATVGSLAKFLESSMS